MADVVVSIGGSTAELDRTVGRALDGFGKMSSQAAGRARVFTSALSLMESQGGKTASVLGSVLAGFATGGVLGIAIGGLNALVGLFNDMSEAERKALEKSKEWGDELNKQITRNRNELFMLFAEMEGGAVGAAQAQAALANAEAEGKVTKAKAEVARIKQELETMQTSGWRGLSGAPIGEAAKLQELEEAQKNLAKAEQARATAVVLGDARTTKVRQAQAQQVADQLAREKAEKDRIPHEAHIRATEEYNAAVEAIEKITEAEEKAREEERAAEEAELVERLEMEQFHADERVRIAEETSARVQQALQPVGNALSTLIQDVVVENKDGFAALEAMARSLAVSMLNTLVQMGMQMVAAKIAKHVAEKPVNVADVYAAAGVAGAEGAAAVAGTPVIGPAMAAAVAATLPSTIVAATLPLAIAERGWAVPDFGSEFPAVLHPKETVIPAWGRHALENMAAFDPERAGGGPLQITVNAVDGQSVKRFVESEDFRVAVRRARRLGWWS